MQDTYHAGLQVLYGATLFKSGDGTFAITSTCTAPISAIRDLALPTQCHCRVPSACLISGGG